MTEHRPGGTTAPHLGVDIGGTKVALRAEDGARCVAEAVFAWQPRRSAEHDLAQLSGHAKELYEQMGAPPSAVGVAMPATVGPGERITAWPSRPEWTGTDLGAALR
ncbi:ROK family protein, partial [Streptomyces sp. SID14478]|uniref:ROK family protein n=1 Tax=Streptomyces sp. SID14478 TaxID=2706073 RepID=UPI0013E0C22F|nr:ROK family protein [Streptomyces sp. SID14478]